MTLRADRQQRIRNAERAGPRPWGLRGVRFADGIEVPAVASTEKAAG
jgi:hypothetical protein